MTGEHFHSYREEGSPGCLLVGLLAMVLGLIGSGCVESRPRNTPVVVAVPATSVPAPSVLPLPTIITEPTIEPTNVTARPTALPRVVLTRTPIPTVKPTPTYVTSSTAVVSERSLATTVMSTTIALSVKADVILPPESFAQEMARLIFENGVDPTKLYVADVALIEWADESLGCPLPGLFYESKDAPYIGFAYTLSDGLSHWEYRTNEDDSVTVRCSEIEPIQGPKVNVSSAANLADATQATLLHRNFRTGEFEVIHQMTEADVSRLIVVFDREIPLLAPINCKTIFRLDFHTSTGVQEIEYLCAEDKNVLTGLQNFWNGMAGRAPVQVGEIIGPYLIGKPIPKLPDK